MPSSLTDSARAALRDGDVAGAAALARRALEAGEPGTHAVLTRAHWRLGDLVTAETHARAALAENDSDSVTRAHLGAILMARGQTAPAIEAFARAAREQPGNAILHNEHGNALAAAGRWRDAAAAYLRSLRLRSDIAEVFNNLGNTLRALGQPAEAAAAYRSALRRNPSYAEALNNIGVLLQQQGDPAGAVDIYRRALALRPGDALLHTHLGTALAALGQLGDGEAAHREALRIDPGLVAAYNNLGIVLKDQGLLREGRAAYASALEFDPGDAGLYSNYLMCLSYDPAIDGAALLAEHRRFAERHEPGNGNGQALPFDGGGLGEDGARAAEKRSTDRLRVRHPPLLSLARGGRGREGPLRIGLVSPDLWTHSVAYFIEPILEHHDPEQLHITCYADVLRPDATTARLRSQADAWRETLSLGDDALLAAIRADGIDILFDLAGHTGNNRLLVFARRAAPVQISWIGYPATTGLSAMDYRVTDAWADPPGETDRFHSETLLRLPQGFLCYRPPGETPLPEGRAAGRAVTFGSFNNLSKVNAEAIALWARILAAVPDSRLLLKSRQLADDTVRKRILDSFAQYGIAAPRLDLRARIASRDDHLALYGEVGVALDTFPYNGTTTTCEALWMGVPVVTMAGCLHAGRVGVSLLSQCGLEEWIARSPEAYVEIVARLARERPTRQELRDRLLLAPLTDGEGFMRRLTAVLRDLWRRHGERGAQRGVG